MEIRRLRPDLITQQDVMGVGVDLGVGVDYKTPGN